jgi:hypothetical protein
MMTAALASKKAKRLVSEFKTEATRLNPYGLGRDTAQREEALLQYIAELEEAANEPR